MASDASPATAPLSARPSFDRESILASPPPINGLNGSANGDPPHEDLLDLDPVQRLQRELDRTKQDKDALAAQYRTLLSKLTTMRTTLGNKLQQDAEELDRQEQLVQQLTAENEDLVATVEALKSELVASNEETERTAKELDSMRSSAFQENTQEAYLRERELRELQGELEECRIERDEWEQKALQEHVAADEARSTLEAVRRELDAEQAARVRERVELENEREQSRNLQSVLEDFQAAKDRELQQAVKSYETKFLDVTQQLAEFKHRALTAELKLEETSTDNSRTQELEKEVKEKSLLIGKLRHEAVIMNEHLMEALRRLRRSSSDTNVDRRLVTNILLQFLATPRADSKRFEMLSLLSTILSWTDDERERAGLQRKAGPAPTGSSSTMSALFGRASPKGKGIELEKTDETESFSRLWVEFLLTEAAAGESTSPPPKSPRANNSLPNSPTRITPHLPSLLSPNGAARAGRRSFTAVAAMSSSPELQLQPPPLRKGKEKESGIPTVPES